MENAPDLEKLQKDLHRRSMACPFFLRGAIMPIPGYFTGRVPLDVIAERADMALQRWNSHECRSTLEESYAPEGEAVRAMIHALGERDFSDPKKEEAFREELWKIAQRYLETPEDRKEYLLY